MIECLASYVGYLAHASMPKNAGTSAATYFQKYQAIVAKTKELGIIPETTYVSAKLDNRGFV